MARSPGSFWGVGGLMIEKVSPEAQAFIAAHRVARLATADADGVPHVIPICYGYDGGYIYSAIDLKPKRVAALELKRVRNVSVNPRVALVIDDYSEDWSQLAFVMVQGIASILPHGEQRSRAEATLRDKYPQYAGLLEEGCTVVRITPEKVVSWGRL